jgi:branched-chain amino acid aminotransferase
MAEASRLHARRIWVDGRLVPWVEATVHVMSQSIQRGSLVFDVMPCYGEPGKPKVFGLREHAERFRRSAELNGMDLPLDLEGILAAIRETVRANPGAEIVKISAYYGAVSLHVLPAEARPSVAVAALALADVLPPSALRRRPSVRLRVADATKIPPRSLSPQLKVAASYAGAAAETARARREGFDEILYLDEKGRVAEGSSQSFLLVHRGTLRAPPLDYVLDGITRRAVLEIAADEGIPVRVAPIQRRALEEAEEACLVGSSTNVWPVECIDDRKFPEPTPGPVTKRLADRLERLLAGDDPVLSPRWLQPV